jgi:Domain of unknown function (DUF5127)/Domain of unknown function (DUF4965)/Domain of unknown function (DUF1793)/Domain of unknown function (DUF4964)
MQEPSRAATHCDGNRHQLHNVDRRTLLKLAGAAATLAPGLSLLDGLSPYGAAAIAAHPGNALKPARTAGSAAQPTVTLGGAAVRPPSIPLAVRHPYLQTWLPSTELAGTTAQFWYGTPRTLNGLVRIDRKLYAWAGQPEVDGVAPPAMTQTAVDVTSTRSIFTLRAHGVELVAEFLSPVEPGSLRLTSVPLSLLTVSVRSIDARRHDVQVYTEITGEWASSESGALIDWQTSRGTVGRYWNIQLHDQQPVSEDSEQMGQWGSAVWGAKAQHGLSYQSGNSAIRDQFARTGKLADVSDPDFRAVDDDQPLFALARDFGETHAGSVNFVIGHVRTPLVSYGSVNPPPLCGDGEPPACPTNGAALIPLWTRYWADWHEMADDFLKDAPAARRRAAKLDAKIERAATKAQGPGYAAMCALSLRQCYGSCELVISPHGDPWLMGKEISSGGNVNTVDIFDQAFLAWLWLDPELVPLIMAPILDWSASATYQNEAGWLEEPSSDVASGQRFCAHDIGIYPIASGVTPFNQEQMPIEENAGQLIMAAAYARKVGAAKAKPFLAKWQSMWTEWADYLVTQVPTPQTQLDTDDWTNPPYEPIAAGVNLGVKALIGLAAAGQIATILGDSANASKWSAAATDNVGQWVARSTDISGKYLNLTQRDYGTWCSLYNAYYQKVIGVQLVPEEVAAMEASYYLTQLTEYGMPMQTDTDNVNKVGWLVMVAAWLEDYPIKAELMARSVKYINDTPSLVPYSDRYDTTTAISSGPKAHATLGVVFAFLVS